MAAPITYIPKFVADADEFFTRLREDLAWIRHADAPRSEYYCNDHPEPYTYGRGAGVRTYNPQPWHPLICEIRIWLQDMLHVQYDVCFLNRYHNQRDQLGWHADDSPEMDPSVPIAIVSLGAERDIMFGRPVSEAYLDTETGDYRRTRPEMRDIERRKLEHGSLCLMAAGMQQEWQHRIPKADRVVGERISLTFRGYKKPTP